MSRTVVVFVWQKARNVGVVMIPDIFIENRDMKNHDPLRKKLTHGIFVFVRNGPYCCSSKEQLGLAGAYDDEQQMQAAATAAAATTAVYIDYRD